MKTVPATKARKEFFKLLNANAKPGMATSISIEGVPKVVMMSAEDYEGWLETLEIMSDKTLMKDLKQAIKEVERGETMTEDEFFAMINKK